MSPERAMQIDRMRSGDPPLPLSVGQAEAQAYRLRVKHGLSYTALARIMGEYHGIWKGETEWRRCCRRRGAPITRPHNVPPHLRGATRG